MELNELLDEDIIELDLKATTKDEVLHELSKLLLAHDYIDDVEGFVSDIYAREAEGITGMGDHIAIPHGISSHAKKIGIAIGRTSSMVEWESYDDEPVNLIFLFCIHGAENSGTYTTKLQAEAELARRLGSAGVIDKLQHVESKKELIDVLTK
ncbi:PTS sugar transporter subunit IIA [Olsenella sp. AGMB03486]|jgi:PTS system fructose-specific IIA component|uniref:PTS sugar transporter subunit IIA n=1 Tax=Olsenella sp. AGMB03486 TaxID=3230364 RepID=UPI00349FEDC8